MEHRERVRQQKFIDLMVENGYELFKPKSYQDIKDNFRRQIEDINEFKFSDSEFNRYYDLINQGTVFERSKKLLREYDITLDNGDIKVIRMLNRDKWCQNNFQISQEVENGDTSARFDSIIFINGLPLTIIEFKQSAVGYQTAIDQIINYKKKNRFHDLFLYCQIFIASSFETTRYFANNDSINREFIFTWTDEDNVEISSMMEGSGKHFYDTFLSRCFLAEMIIRFTIQKEKDKVNLILRPYQVYAVKKILEKVKDNASGKEGNGFIFHTTGSGKTITSFKTCKLLSTNKDIDKVIFLVDRKDLDAQTKSEYDSFEKGSYDDAENSKQLKENIFSNSNKIVVGTIQKMLIIINNLNEEEIATLLSKRYVLVIDECHRSQADKSVNTLREVFNPDTNSQYFGFTGTPIFEENSKDGDVLYQTTESIFGKELHRYSITNAVKDNNVLQFNINYFGDANNEDVDFYNQERIDIISKHIVDTYDNYNDNRSFNAILATTSKEQLKLYYKSIKQYNETLEKNKRIKFTCIFSLNKNEEILNSEDFKDPFYKEVIEDFNNTFKTNLTLEDPENFKNKVYDYVREKDLDLVIVVNMLLTGFDSPVTKTLYIDKNLRYHTLLQAYSRVNRKKENKEFGNIVTFIDQKEDRDKALELFSNGGTVTDFEIKPYEELVEKFNQQLNKTKNQCIDGSELRRQLQHTLDTGDDYNFKESLEQIKELQKQYSFLKVNSKFKEEDINTTRKEMNDLKDAYREVSKSFKQTKDKVDNKEEQLTLDYDFELNLFENVRINLEYLINLMKDDISKDDKAMAKKRIEEFDTTKEIRDTLLIAVEQYTEDCGPLEYYIDKIVEERKINQLIEEAGHIGIIDENKDKFLDIANSQMLGEVNASQSNVYKDVMPEGLNFKEKRKFKEDVFNMVREVDEIYGFKK